MAGKEPLFAVIVYSRTISKALRERCVNSKQNGREGA